MILSNSVLMTIGWVAVACISIELTRMWISSKLRERESGK